MWQASVEGTIARLRRLGIRPGAALAIRQKAMMDQFRGLNALYAGQVAVSRDRALTIATWLAAGAAALLSVILVLAGIWSARRLAARESARIRRQQELSELLQASVSERESQELLIHHVERLAPEANAAVLERNNSDDRLEPVLSEDPGALAALAGGQLRPRSCMAIRLSRPYAAAPGDDSLVACEACGQIGSGVVCEPLLVGGQVIGSVLIARGHPLNDAERADVRDSAFQAAPILSNQRNLALAERRAASDALTGLPNRRAADETLKRMAAHAGRTVTPLSAALLDLDHFKRINDIHGHERGDEALAVVGQVLVATIRTSDFAARFGGEEFLLLLPDTDTAGAIEVCEKLRRAIQAAEIADVPSISASFGVATLPDDAADPETLLRRADRALYAAKARGRQLRAGRRRRAAGRGGPRRRRRRGPDGR
ncbi:MAG TPA: GGDEF domain-containing protein [Solirubrobacteraceae bacterium]|nr:GGDEF domain-containing protein [Solirubrobacteraceae bacterium]